jgi:hypothetical protein
MNLLVFPLEFYIIIVEIVNSFLKMKKMFPGMRFPNGQFVREHVNLLFCW